MGGVVLMQIDTVHVDTTWYDGVRYKVSDVANNVGLPDDPIMVTLYIVIGGLLAVLLLRSVLK